MIPSIQLINPKKVSEEKYMDIETSQYSNFKSFDSFEFNIINLNNELAWHYSYKNFKNDKDFMSMFINIKETKEKNIIFILPQNFHIKEKGKVKNNLNLIYSFFNIYTDFVEFSLIYGKTKTQTKSFEIESDFFFTNCENYNILTKNTNHKPTTIQKGKYVLTTLNLSNEDEIISFLKDTDLINSQTPVPEWFDEIQMFDDDKQKQRIEENNKKINDLEEDNKEAEKIIEENNEFKSILYKQSDELVKPIFKILENMLDCNLSEFKDHYKEDFLIMFNDVTFVGEIKGVNRNVSNRDLSQLDNHITEREDLLEKENRSENLKPILIMNTFIKKHPYERPAVEEVTINKAKNKYDTLIITSLELLKLYEKFKKGHIAKDEILNRFKNETGLFEV